MGECVNLQMGVNASNGKYFCLFGGLDQVSNNYIEILLKTISENPNAVIAAGKTKYVDFKGNQTNVQSLLSTPGLSKSAKFLSLMHQNQIYVWHNK